MCLDETFSILVTFYWFSDCCNDLTLLQYVLRAFPLIYYYCYYYIMQFECSDTFFGLNAIVIGRNVLIQYFVVYLISYFLMKINDRYLTHILLNFFYRFLSGEILTTQKGYRLNCCIWNLNKWFKNVRCLKEILIKLISTVNYFCWLMIFSFWI